jgi:acetoin utilization deacetylase AcuC-like enzyme
VCGALEKLHAIKPIAATKKDLLMFHTTGYVDMIELLNQVGGEAGDCAPFGKGSYDIALLSVGGVFEAIRSVVSGQVRNACM